MQSNQKHYAGCWNFNTLKESVEILTLSLPVTRICVNFSTVYNDMLVAKGLNSIREETGSQSSLGEG